MKKIFVLFVTILAFSYAASAQHIHPEYVEISPALEKDFNSAKVIVYTGSILECASAACSLAGVLVSGSDSTSKTGKALKIAGFSGMLLSAGIIYAGSTKMRKVKNSSGKEVALLTYGVTDHGTGISIRF